MRTHLSFPDEVFAMPLSSRGDGCSMFGAVILTRTDKSRVSGRVSSVVNGFWSDRVWRIRGELPSVSLSEDPSRDKTHEAQTGNDKSDRYGSRT